MQIKLMSTESDLFNGKVIRFSEWETIEEIVEQEAAILLQYEPVYIYCAIDTTNVASIQYLERHGYGFSEFRIHSLLQIDNNFEATEAPYPYRLELLGDGEHLLRAQKMLEDQLPDDRFFNDPLMDKEIARNREMINLEKSFNSWPKEFILGLFNIQTNKLIGFRSGAFRSEKEVDYYLYGIGKGLDKQQFSQMLDRLSISFLYQRGVRFIHSVTTGFNTHELNRLIKHHGFKVETTEVILRKVF